MGVVTGFAKLEHDPGEAFMELLVDTCVAGRLRDFNPQNLANTINGESRYGGFGLRHWVTCG
jgi:hypothetical protein